MYISSRAVENGLSVNKVKQRSMKCIVFKYIELMINQCYLNTLISVTKMYVVIKCILRFQTVYKIYILNNGT